MKFLLLVFSAATSAQTVGFRSFVDSLSSLDRLVVVPTDYSLEISVTNKLTLFNNESFISVYKKTPETVCLEVGDTWNQWEMCTFAQNKVTVNSIGQSYQLLVNGTLAESRFTSIKRLSGTAKLFKTQSADSATIQSITTAPIQTSRDLRQGPLYLGQFSIPENFEISFTVVPNAALKGALLYISTNGDDFQSELLLFKSESVKIFGNLIKIPKITWKTVVAINVFQNSVQILHNGSVVASLYTPQRNMTIGHVSLGSPYYPTANALISDFKVEQSTNIYEFNSTLMHSLVQPVYLGQLEKPSEYQLSISLTPTKRSALLSSILFLNNPTTFAILMMPNSTKLLFKIEKTSISLPELPIGQETRVLVLASSNTISILYNETLVNQTSQKVGNNSWVDVHLGTFYSPAPILYRNFALKSLNEELLPRDYIVSATSLNATADFYLKTGNGLVPVLKKQLMNGQIAIKKPIGVLFSSILFNLTGDASINLSDYSIGLTEPTSNYTLLYSLLNGNLTSGIHSLSLKTSSNACDLIDSTETTYQSVCLVFSSFKGVVSVTTDNQVLYPYLLLTERLAIDIPPNTSSVTIKPLYTIETPIVLVTQTLVNNQKFTVDGCESILLTELTLNLN